MYLLSKEGGKNLLEFLRNLTAQVLWGTTATILYMIWRQNGSTKMLILFVLIAAVTFIALIANTNNFMDNAFSQSAAIAAERDRLTLESVPKLARIPRLLKYILVTKPVTFVELGLALCVLYGGLYVIVTTVGLTVLRIAE